MAVHANDYYTMRAGFTRQEPRPAVLSAIQNAVLIYNPTAGRMRGRLRQLEKARQILHSSGIEAHLWGTTGPGAATALARQAVAEKRGLVIASGGDGTINEVVNGLAGSQVPLAVLPAGTANVLGKELELPWDVEAAAHRIAGASLRRIALGAAIFPGSESPRYFIAVAGAGPDAQLVYAVSLGLKKKVGVLAYWFEGFRQAALYSFPAFRVISNGEEHIATTLVVGRTKHYGGPAMITTEASLFEDQFEVMISTTRSRIRNLAGIPWLLANRHRTLKHVRFWKTTTMRVEPMADARVYAQVDGEGIGRIPVEFRIVPNALTLAVPKRP